MWPLLCVSDRYQEYPVILATGETDKISDAAVPLKLVARKLAGLGTGRRIGDAARAAEDRAVEGQDSGSLDELGRVKTSAQRDMHHSGDLHAPSLESPLGESVTLSHMCEAGAGSRPEGGASMAREIKDK